MDEELKATRISLIVHAVVAALAGWTSLQIQLQSRALFGLAAGIIILLATGFIAEKAVKKKGMKWWAGNGLIVYLFVWFVTWVYLFNTQAI